jgi:glycosyltransferase involved in cell wall biosynthesis
MSLSYFGRSLAVVPAFNEAATIVGVVERLLAHPLDLDVLVVDDGSLDGTAQLAAAAGAEVLRHPFNLGIGGAVQSGFLYARDKGYDAMVQVDGDGQHDPAELDKLFAAVAADPSIDVVCGSRFLGADMRYPAAISRRTGIHIFAALLSLLVRMRISDPTSGFRLYNRRAIELFARDYPHDFPEVEAVLMLHHHRLRLQETPVRMYARGGGASSLKGSGKSAYYMVKVLLALFVALCRRRPVPEPSRSHAAAVG